MDSVASVDSSAPFLRRPMAETSKEAQKRLTEVLGDEQLPAAVGQTRHADQPARVRDSSQPGGELGVCRGDSV
jgi:hypothetical protein